MLMPKLSAGFSLLMKRVFSGPKIVVSAFNQAEIRLEGFGNYGWLKCFIDSIFSWLATIHAYQISNS